MYPFTYLGAFCGMRRSEALGLRFRDVRWFDNEIRIQYAVSKRRCQDGIHKWEWYLGHPKSRKSLRGISATESVMRLLADLKVGNADSGFVFAGDCHGFIDPDRFEIDIRRPIVDRAGLASTRFHDLRHFFASQLIANGETAACVRDQMGHSSNLETGKKQQLNKLFALNRRVLKAYLLKESLDRLWTYRYEGAMMRSLHNWMDQLRWQRLNRLKSWLRCWRITWKGF